MAPRDGRQGRILPTPSLLLIVLCTLVFLTGACGQDSVATAGSDQPAPQPAADEPGLAVRITGSVEGSVICPAGDHACLAFRGDVEPDSEGRAWVAGRIVDGHLEVDEQLPLSRQLGRHYVNRCPDRDLVGPPPEEWLLANEGMTEGDSYLPEGYANFWYSDDGVSHIAIAGNKVEWEQYLEAEGLTDRICLVEFAYSEQELRALSHKAEALTAEWGPGGASTGDTWAGVINVYVDWLDVDRRAKLAEFSAANGDVPVVGHAPVDVLDDTFAAYQAAIAGATVELDPAASLAATCGPVRFSSIPPDFDEFPALDAEAEQALAQLATGEETSLEAGFLEVDGRTWSIAHRSDTELILFGRDADPAAVIADGAVYARFDRSTADEPFRPSGWGGCWIQVESATYGNASIAFDTTRPPDPSSTELPLVINERNCASGRAPERREIVPVVTEDDSQIVIVVLVEPAGDPSCPSNPWHPITVTLDSPLGDRTVLDGHTSPPVTIDEATPGEHG